MVRCRHAGGAEDFVMTPEERQLLSQLFDRMHAAGRVPRDREAEDFIAQAMREQPYAPYLMAQTVIVQEEALKQAAARIEALEAELKTKEAGSGSFLAGIGRSVLGTGSVPSVNNRAMEPGEAQRASPWGRSPGAPQPAGQTGGNPLFGQQGQRGSFLQTAMATAAGVAGGALLAHGLQSMFSGAGQTGTPQALAGDVNGSAAPAATEGGMIPDVFGPEDRAFKQASYQDEADAGFDVGGDDSGGDDWA
jgi:hypothetical protein